MKERPAARAAAKPETTKPLAAFAGATTEGEADAFADEEADFVIMVLAAVDFWEAPVETGAFVDCEVEASAALEDLP